MLPDLLPSKGVTFAFTILLVPSRVYILRTDFPFLHLFSGFGLYALLW